MITLMIVEDEQLECRALRKIISETCQSRVHIVEDAFDGREAIIKARKFCPDIILMDIGLPEVNGIESQEKIIDFLPNVQTIMITAYSDFYYMQKAIQNKIVDYLLKPVRPRDLKITLNRILEKVEEKKTGQTIEVEEPLNIVQKIVNFIDRECCKKITLKMIADEVHLNPQYLSRKFKKNMQVGIMEYINQKRVEHAKDFLINTGLPIYRIAQETGFSDAAHFSKVFSKLENRNPSIYRRMCQ